MDQPVSSPPQPFTDDVFEQLHVAAAQGGLTKRLFAQAFGDEYPAEVDPTSSCTWSVLGEMVKMLRLRPNDLLVDLGCGRGGTGLWLARAFRARLIGVDSSPKGIELAIERIPEFFPALDTGDPGDPGDPGAGRIRFQLGTFEDTGLPDACAAGVVSLDALPFTPDRDVALRELRRILKPGARAVFTGGEKLPGHPKYKPGEPTWEERLASAGLELEAKAERPEEAGLWSRLHDLWEAHEDELRREYGDVDTDNKMAEARTLRPIRPFRTAALYTARAPLA